MKSVKLLLLLSGLFFCSAESRDEFEFSFEKLVEEIKPNEEFSGLDFFGIGDFRKTALDQLAVFNGLTPQLLFDQLRTIKDSIAKSPKPKAEMSYLFADVKFDGQNLKILEIGEGKNGGFRSFDAVFEEGRIWKKFWEYAASFGLPIFYVGQGPSPDPINKIGITLDQKVAWHTFMEVSGRWAKSLAALQDRDDFQELANLAPRGDGSAIKHYKAIVVFKCRDDREPKLLVALEDFKKKYPDFLVLDCVSRPFAASKHLNDILFRSTQDTACYRPACKLYPKEYHTDLAQQIVDDLDSDFFVIKPLDSGMSNGVIMTSVGLLDADLKRILTRKVGSNIGHQGTFNYRPVDTQSYSYWVGDTNRQFIVEAYAPSRTIEVLGKKYDPTIRVVFTLVHDNGTIKVKMLEHWWKLPPKALDEYAILTLKHVSQYRPDLKQLPADELTLSEEDEHLVRSLMADAMARAYVKMLILESGVI